MRSYLHHRYLAAWLLGTCALLSFSCARILGADFDKTFSSGGTGGTGSTGGAGGATVSGTAASTVTGSGSSSGGGMGGAGGGGPVASCPGQPGALSGYCTVHVFVKIADPDAGPVDHVTSDAVLTFSSAAPSGYESMPTSTFKLARASSSSNGISMFSCLEQDGTHTLAFTSPCEGGILLGYMASSGLLSDYEALEWFNTGNGLGTNDHNRALIVASDHFLFCPPSAPYGVCETSSLFAPNPPP